MSKAAGTRFGVAKRAEIVAVQLLIGDLGPLTEHPVLFLSQVLFGLSRISLDRSGSSNKPSVLIMNFGFWLGRYQIDPTTTISCCSLW